MRRLSLHVLLESIPDAIVDRYMSQVCSNWVLLKWLVEVLLVKPLGRVQPYLQVLTWTTIALVWLDGVYGTAKIVVVLIAGLVELLLLSIDLAGGSIVLQAASKMTTVLLGDVLNRHPLINRIAMFGTSADQHHLALVELLLTLMSILELLVSAYYTTTMLFHLLLSALSLRGLLTVHLFSTKFRDQWSPSGIFNFSISRNKIN